MASPVAGGASEPDAVEYPERHWIAQSVWHGDGVRLATAALHDHFNDRDNVLVAGSWWCTKGAATTGLGCIRTCRSRSTASAQGTAGHSRCGTKARVRQATGQC